MNAQVFDEIREIVYAESGIRLQDGKEGMVSARLARRLRSLDLADEAAYLEYLKDDIQREIVDLLDVISTNITHFFRESEHFDFYKSYVEELMAAGQRRFRVWCAASSTGEEPYTLAMVLSDAMKKCGAKMDARILATDICTEVLERARAGVYSEENVSPIPTSMMRRYFTPTKGPKGNTFTAKDCLKEMLLFKRLNLSAPPFQMKGPMDVIFCRNVMIYFDDPVRDALVQEFLRILRPGGYLIVGQSESLLRWGELVEPIGPSVYRKRS